MKKNIWLILLVAFMVPVLMTQNAWAGSKQRHRWEGVAIGLGAVLLGNALCHAYDGYYPPAYGANWYRPTPRCVPPPPVKVYPQTQIIYHTREVVRTDRHHRHHRKPWGCDKPRGRHTRHW